MKFRYRNFIGNTDFAVTKDENGSAVFYDTTAEITDGSAGDVKVKDGFNEVTYGGNKYYYADGKTTVSAADYGIAIGGGANTADYTKISDDTSAMYILTADLAQAADATDVTMKDGYIQTDDGKFYKAATAKEAQAELKEGVVETTESVGSDFQKIQDEIDALQKEFERINTDTEFNKKKLLDGTYTDQYLQIGANNGQGIEVTIDEIGWEMDAMTTVGKDNSAVLDQVDTMIENVNSQRSKLGAVQNRLEYAVKVDDNTAENMQSAESQIRDTDMADEMTRFSKESILQQAATSMLAQANQANQGVLSLLS